MSLVICRGFIRKGTDLKLFNAVPFKCYSELTSLFQLKSCISPLILVDLRDLLDIGRD